MLIGRAFPVFLISLATLDGAPIIPGLQHHKQQLTDKQSGMVLASELRCAACHEGLNESTMKSAPDLREVGSRVTRDYLQKFIANPSEVHPGTTMPDMLAGKSDEERQKIAESISYYLASLKSKEPRPTKGAKATPKEGHALYHKIGCVACHSTIDPEGKTDDETGVLSLAHVAGKYQEGALGDFLFDPLRSRPSGRMPDMKLSKDEAATLASFLEGNAKKKAPADFNPQLAAAGKHAFAKYNCVACHQIDDTPAEAKLSLSNFDQGCLSKAPESAPNFHLEDDQIKSLKAALHKPDEIQSADQIKLRLTQLNCIACHVRDDYGGVAPHLDVYFNTSEEALGNDARIPPPLTLIGAKLRPEWLNKVLYDGESIRPYMHTRMPQYGEESLAGLPELFAKVDHIKPVDLPEPDRESKPQMRNGAHLLLGDKGLNCISCHNFNGKESPGMKGLDLMTSFQRLQPGYFYDFMQNPAKYRPGIIMPSYWPGGKAVQTDILEGDTHRQLQALWRNFSLGRSARDPSGLRSPATNLVVTDKTRTYRGRSRVAGYRGIAVGFPGGMNYAFNAQNGALSSIWKGQFVTANWRSQGAGDFNPAERAIQLAQDVGFMKLANDEGKWPLRPTATKENPVNADPLYPRNRGYQFKGYSFDESGTPTFSYQCHEVAIEDKTTSPEDRLHRTLSFSTEKETTLYFRALTGKVKKISDTVYQSEKLEITLPSGTILLRENEVLLKISVPSGNSAITIDYHLLP
ncbi:c-type cytochrome [bacterium]|nr:c-type cytochrome [bacterium]